MRGIDYVELRATIAGFVDILRLSLRQGWIGNYENRNTVPPRRRDGKRGLRVFRRLRRMAGLVLPQGPAAQKLGLVFAGELPDGWIPLRERRKQGHGTITRAANARGAPARAPGG